MVVAALAAALLALAGCSANDGGGNGLQGGESEVIGEADEGIDGVIASGMYWRPSTMGPRRHHPTPAGEPGVVESGFYDEAPGLHAGREGCRGGWGFLLIWSACAGLADADVEVIHDLARANPKVVAAPYPALESGEAVVATAWARQLRLDSVDDERLGQFVEQYQDGSQAPESGSRCTGGPLGEPIP